ncbi:MAG: DNA-protecting protein DprA [Lachnospiraceae bacterium]|nr:DNA-protecting protein DprA [Lachnospiraceae bacterium]
MGEKIQADDLLFAKEAAEYLGITVQRLNKLIQEEKIKPLKKNASGTIFHIDELNRRKEELAIFTGVGNGGKKGMFVIDTKTKQEALNYATLMNVLDMTELRLEPLFDELSKNVSVDVPIDNPEICEKYCEFFKIPESVLLKVYEKAKKAFSGLKETDEIIKRGSEDYPPLLLETEQAPRFLYIRGKKSLLFEKRTVALVGSRQASPMARENTKRLAEVLGKNGITVISGLAKGIDVSAHMAALQSGYNTIAVIGTNLNQYYPAENKEVQLEIEKKGLVVSQFSPASKTQRWFFPMRNGVMSGLSLATVIMEAGETSGALKQADFALKQGRQIMIPESALKLEKITWPERYVKRGASVVKTPMEVIRLLAENNIFKPSKRSENTQQTFESYLSELATAPKKEMHLEWNESVSVEE